MTCVCFLYFHLFSFIFIYYYYFFKGVSDYITPPPRPLFTPKHMLSILQSWEAVRDEVEFTVEGNCLNF